MEIEFRAVKRKTQFSFVTPVTEEVFKDNHEINIEQFGIQPIIIYLE